MSDPTISTNEILDALREAAKDNRHFPTNAWTTFEIGVAMKWGAGRTIRHLRKLKDSGGLECVRVEREALDGRLARVPGYRFLRKPPQRSTRPSRKRR